MFYLFFCDIFAKTLGVLQLRSSLTSAATAGPYSKTLLIFNVAYDIFLFEFEIVFERESLIFADLS